MTDTNPRDLIRRLTEKLDELNCNFNVPNQSALIAEARAALAQPEPQGPSRPAIEPVPVAERLPGPEECDAEGRCWWFSPPACGPHTIRPCWTFDSETLEGDTHWLPRWALPVPQQEGEQ